MQETKPPANWFAITDIFLAQLLYIWVFPTALARNPAAYYPVVCILLLTMEQLTICIFTPYPTNPAEYYPLTLQETALNLINKVLLQQETNPALAVVSRTREYRRNWCKVDFKKLEYYFTIFVCFGCWISGQEAKLLEDFGNELANRNRS
ncbi:Hypothetical_protein [Hexamita inflata]|uniref:Hypothetical_protein n=1 Tax=Hexamita inflata TaxID=28002 RepID=A0AA86PHJ7_9EUKA|nr:Hypothetical protein HINF_LOCUS26138 [Hexamita inflata]CAI9938496.1 Hypothetical protein HINF_LOCUS26141 [Hexamita inflata]